MFRTLFDLQRPQNRSQFASLRGVPGFVAAVFSALCAPAVLSYSNLGNNSFQSNGSARDTQAAIAAAPAGGTVIIPSGTFSWPTAVTISKPITLQGASPSNRPVITSSYSAGAGIVLVCRPNQTITIKDIRFINWSASNSLILLGGGGENAFRLTNLDFDGGHGKWCIWVSTPGGSGGEGPYGLIDHCTWLNGGSVIFIRDNPLSNPNSWHRNMSFGTNKAVYIEDCTFSARGNPTANAAFDGDNGCRIVFRHNTLTNFLTCVHGADSSGPINSGLQAEVMHNTYRVTSYNGQPQGLETCFYLRGGTAAFFDNTITAESGSGYNGVVKLQFYRSVPGGYGVCKQDRFYPKDYLGTMQPGMGVTPEATGQDPHYPNEPWVSVPVYYWNNHVEASIWFRQILVDSAFMQQERDYFVDIPKPGYAEFTYPHPLTTSGPPPATTPNSQHQINKKNKKPKRESGNESSEIPRVK